MSDRPILDTIYARRSIRSYVPGKQVEREKIDTLLKAAMAAPSACNLQPWEFIIIEGDEAMDALRPHVGGGQFYAPMAMIVCARTEYIPWEGEGWQVDCGAAIENMMLAAVEMGLGSLFIGDFEKDAIRKMYGIPEEIALCNVVYFGYPAETKRPVTRYKEEAVYWGKYDSAQPHAKRTIQGMIQESIEDS